MKKIIAVLILAAVMLSLAGCWNRRELNTLAILASTYYDIEKNDDISITAEVFDPALTGSSAGDKPQTNTAHVITSVGKTSPEALRNFTRTFSKKQYVPYVLARFYTEEFAKKDIMRTFDFIVRNHETRASAFIVVVKEQEHNNLYKCSTQMSHTIGGYISDLAVSQPSTNSNSVFVTTIDFLKAYYNYGQDPVAGVVEVVKKEKKLPTGQKSDSQTGDNAKKGVTDEKSKGGSDELPQQDEYELVYSGLAVFRDTKLVGYFDEMQARAYNIISNNMQGAYINVPIEDKLSVFEVLECKTKIEAKWESDKVKIKVKSQFDLAVAQEIGNKKVNEQSVQAQMQSAFNEHVKKQLEDAMRKAQKEYNCDIFAFGEYFHSQNAKVWKDIKTDWNKYYADAEIETEVNCNIKSTGKITSPLTIKDDADQ